MFREWLNENKIESYDFSGEILPKAQNREFWHMNTALDFLKSIEKLPSRGEQL
ncbi:MAG: hypothetical protein IJZ16_02405 [Clostridia bacterium]|nr:hypothetical protein [Clostridia bacterium]